MKEVFCCICIFIFLSSIITYLVSWLKMCSEKVTLNIHSNKWLRDKTENDSVYVFVKFNYCLIWITINFNICNTSFIKWWLLAYKARNWNFYLFLLSNVPLIISFVIVDLTTSPFSFISKYIFSGFKMYPSGASFSTI